MSSRARRWLFAAVVLVFSALFVRLGVWQLDRLGERRAAVAERRAELERPAREIGAALVASRPGDAPLPTADSAGWRRVVLEGRFDYAREAVLAPRSWQGSPAVYVVTPLVVADSAAVAVLRGSVPASDGLHAPLERARPVWARSDSAARGAVVGRPLAPGEAPDARPDTGDGPPRRFATRPAAPRVTVHGTAYPPPGGEPVTDPDTLHAAGGVHAVLPRMDPARLDSIWPWRTAGFYVRADSSSERIPPGEHGLALPRPVPPPALDDGPHLLYALQWFSFAAIALVGGGIWLWREREG